MAHDLITAESAQAYLAAAQRLQQVIVSGAPAAERAQANVELGKLLDEIRALLNRDLDAHGRVRSLSSSLLVSELVLRGTPLTFSATHNRFAANLQYYREALKLAPAGAVAADAMFGLLQGNFYDSFTGDPLQPRAQDAGELTAQIGLAQAFLGRYPDHAGSEEVSFILAIHYMQAARATTGGEREAFAQRARRATEAFRQAYPESMRAAALPRLLERIAPP